MDHKSEELIIVGYGIVGESGEAKVKVIATTTSTNLPHPVTRVWEGICECGRGGHSKYPPYHSQCTLRNSFTSVTL